MSLSRPGPVRGETRAAGASSSRGFTLVELAITVAVLAILSAIAVPAMQNLLNMGRLSGGTEEVTATLHIARSEAVRRNRAVTVCGGSTGSDACVAGTEWTQLIVRHDAGSATDPTVIRRYELSEALQLESSVAQIRFRPSGTVNAEETLSVCLPTSNPAENIRVITLLLGGGVVSAKGSGGGSC